MGRCITARAGLCAAVCMGALWAQAPKAKAAYPGGDDYRARAAWFMSFRQSHDELSPAAHRLRAWRQAQQIPALHPPPRTLSAATVGGSPAGAPPAGAPPANLGGNWSPLGPQPENDPQFGAVAGRLTAIAADLKKDPSGNTVYVGAADGGLWESTDALSASPTFSAIGDGMPSLAVGAIALDSSTTPTTIYVGTGEGNGSEDNYYGVGILKSSDGGQTWTNGTGVNFLGSGITRLLIDPTNPQILLAAVTESGVYVSDDSLVSSPSIGIVRSSDGGATWTQVYRGVSVTDLLYVPITPTSGYYYAAARATGILRSSDQGQTWQPMGNPLGGTAISIDNFYRVSLALGGGQIYALMADSQGLPVSATDCNGSTACTGLAVSGDGGVTWTPLNVPSGLYGANQQGTYDQYIAVPPAASTLVIGGIDVWSAPLGSNPLAWTNLTNSYGSGSVHMDEHAFLGLDALRWFVANDGGIWYTPDQGSQWSNLNATLNTIQFYSVSADPATVGRYLGGSQDNGTALSSGTAAWSEIWGGDGGHTAINHANPQQLFTENIYVSLKRSDDGGTSFLPVVDSKTITGPTEFYTPYALTADAATVYLATQEVWKGPAVPTTTGAGWQAISGNLTHPMGAMDPTADLLTAIAVAPSDPGTVYVGAFDGALSASHNATSAQPTWTQVALTGLRTTAPLTAIAVNPTDPNTVYWGYSYVGATVNNLLFKSTDGGVTPINIVGNLPSTPINAIVIDPAHPSNIYVATDVGVFVAGDGGTPLEQWARLGSNLPATAVLSLSLTPASGSPVLVAGTHGRGAWSIPAVAPPGFAISANPISQAVEAGQTATYTLTTTASNGASTITLDCGGESDCVITPATLAAGGTATVAVTRAQGGFPSPITINASNGFSTQSLQLQLTTYDFNMFWPTGSASSTLQLGQSQSFSFNLVDLSGTPAFDAPIALSCPNAPTGVTCTFNPATVASLGSTTPASLQIQAGANAPPGALALDVRGVGGHVTRDLTLKLNLAQFILTANPTTVITPAGTPQVFSVVASSVSNFAGNIALTCAVTGQSPAACAVQPASITAGQSSTVTVSGLPGNLSDTITVTGVGGSTQVTAQAVAEAGDFALQANGNATIPGSNVASATVTVFSGFTGFSPSIALSCPGTGGLSCSFNPASITPGQTSTVSVSGLAGLPASNNIPLVITGTAGALQHSVTASLANNGDFQLSPPQTPPNPVLPGEGQTFNFEVTSLNNFFGDYAAACGTGLAFPCSVIPAAIAGLIGTTGATVTATALPSPGPDNVPVVVTVVQGGTTLSHTLTIPLVIGDFTLAPQATTASVNPGGTAAYSIYFHTTPGLSAKVNWSCTGLPAGAKCEYNNPATVFDGSSSAILITTPASAAPPTNPGQAGGALPPWELLSGMLLLLVAAISHAGRRRPWLLAGALLVASVACGGGSSGGGSTGGGGGGGGTTLPPPVTSTITITATDAAPNVANPVSRSVSVQLTVQ